MAINPKIAYIMAEGYNRIAQIGLEIVHNFDDGYGESEKQNEIRKRLVKGTKILRRLSRFVEFDDNGNYVAVRIISDEEVNDLLKDLVKVLPITGYTTAPKIFYRGYPPVVQTGGGGGGGGSSDVSSLPDGQIFVGNSSNLPTPRTPGGVISMTNLGVFSLNNGVVSNVHIANGAAIAYSKLNLSGSIVNADVATGAAISYSKLNLSGSIVNADVSSSAAIARTKIANGTANRLVINNGSGVMSDHAAITANRALVSNGSGLPVASNVTDTELGYSSGLTGNIQSQFSGKQDTIVGAASTVVTSNLTANRALVSGSGGKIEVHPNTTLTEIGYVNGVTGPIQSQLNARLAVTLTSPAEGDIIMYNGSAWVNLARGTNGQHLIATSTTIQWQTPSAGNVPSGGTTGQVLRKNSNTDYDLIWSTFALLDLGVTVSASDVNTLTGIGSNVQSQLNNKLGTSLAANNLWVGNGSGVATPTTDLPSGTTIGSAVIYRVGGSDVTLADGGTGASLASPGADRIMFWDDSAGQVTWLTPGTNISITGTTISASSGIGGSTGSIDKALLMANGTGGSTLQASNLFEGTSGNLVLGASSLAGTGRGILAQGSASNIDIQITSKGSGSITLWNSSVDAGVIMINSGNELFTKDAFASTVRTAAVISRYVTSAPSAGVGTALTFQTQTSTSPINNEVGGAIESVSTDITSGSEDFDMVFKTMSGGATASERLRITSDGRLYGTALHNNAGSVTGTTNQYIASGTYTPSRTSVLNVSSSSSNTFQWLRVGNVVTISGSISVTPTLNGVSTSIRISFPISTNITSATQCSGTAWTDLGTGASVSGDSGTGTALVAFTALSTGAHVFYITATYLIS